MKSKLLNGALGIWGTLALASTTSLAFGAGSVSSTKISSVNVNVDGTVLIALANGTTGKPSCALDNERMAFQATTDGGKAVLNAVMAAYLAGKTVTITGTGTCIAVASTGGSQFEKISNLYFF